MNIERFTKALSDILSEKHGLNITIKAERREEDKNGRNKKILLAEA